MNAPKIIEGEPFDEPTMKGGGGSIPLYKQWLYLLVPVTIAFIYWMFGETIKYWWISTMMFHSPNQYNVKVRKSVRFSPSNLSNEQIRDELSL